MSSAPFPNPADASTAQIVLAVRALAPLVAITRVDAEEIPEAAYLASVFHAVFQIVGGDARRRADLEIEAGLRAMLDDIGDEGGDDVPDA